MSKPNYQIKCQAGRAEIHLYDVISSDFGIGPRQVARDLKDLGSVKSIDVRLNTPGGNIYDGTALYNIFKGHPAKVTMHVDGLAASIGSLIAMAGDKIQIAENAWMVIHDPIGAVWDGDAEEHREMADLLDRLKVNLVNTYAKRTGNSTETIEQMMVEETWLSGSEAVELGFADTVTESLQVAANVDPERFPNTPQEFLNRTKEITAMAEANKAPKSATFDELKAACPGATPDFLCSQMEVKAIAGDATAAWSTYQIKAAKQETADAKAEADKAKADAEKAKTDAKAEVDKAKIDAKAAIDKAEAAAKAPGSDPLRDDGDGKGGKSNDPPADGDFWAVVDAKIQAGMKKPQAIKAAVREEPELHDAMLESNVVTRKRKR